MYTRFYLIIAVMLLIGCNEEKPVTIVEPVGTKYAVSDKSMEDTYKAFMDQLNQKEGVSIVAEVDYKAAAEFVQMELFPAKHLLFANPAIGTPLLQRNQLAALDLPHHVLFFRHAEGEEIYAMYNSVEYLETRYELQGLPELDDISKAVENMITSATGAKIKKAPEQRVSGAEGIITIDSWQEFDQTYLRLRESVTDNVDWRMVAEVDHQANAADVGMELRPTKVIFLSNPDIETTVLQSNPNTGLDFPQKILVWQTQDGTVKISYNNPVYLQQRHKITEHEIELAEMATTLQEITEVAARDTLRYKGEETLQGDTETNF